MWDREFVACPRLLYLGQRGEGRRQSKWMFIEQLLCFRCLIHNWIESFIDSWGELYRWLSWVLNPRYPRFQIYSSFSTFSTISDYMLLSVKCFWTFTPIYMYLFIYKEFACTIVLLVYKHYKMQGIKILKCKSMNRRHIIFFLYFILKAAI